MFRSEWGIVLPPTPTHYVLDPNFPFRTSLVQCFNALDAGDSHLRQAQWDLLIYTVTYNLRLGRPLRESLVTLAQLSA